MMMRIALMLSLIASSAACTSKQISETEARDLASKALARHCAAEKLSPGSFSIKKIGPVGDFPWFIVYQSSGIRPPQEVAVSVDKRGSVELSVYDDGRED